ncbi:hypothetical protein H696_04361 [Fonticula alba]|uniref:Vacuolar protein 8 n=1 Tax=Fonticula alba TaxID=691883 RepID=A0A058Z606_FONAL|nr:hypothetical protein H696_04361 [Fonticula alba]KCV68942.1 hypothetical protein H696_04361 [Fonticula alba]|eukprot:XP_009496513.1 hypothetical protein H696_04361 [Fonticula alba]
MGCCNSSLSQQGHSDQEAPLLNVDERHATQTLVRYTQRTQYSSSMMNNHDEVTLDQALSAVSVLCYSNELSMKRSASLFYLNLIKEEGFRATRETLKPLMNLLTCDDLEVLRPATIALGNLAATDSRNKTLIVELQGLRLLTNLLINPSSDILCNVCGCFTNLSSSDENKSRIVECGALPFLVALCSFPDVRVVRNACGTLLNLSQHRPNCQHLIRAGCLTVFITLLSSDDPDTVKYASAALSNLAVIPDYRREMLQYIHPLLTGLVHCIKGSAFALQPSLPHIQTQAALALLNLASDDIYQLRIANAGAIPYLLKILQQDTPTLTLASVALLRNLSIHPDNEAELVRGNCIPLLLGLIEKTLDQLEDHPANVTGAIRNFFDLICHCVSCLRNISTSDQNREAFLESRGVEIFRRIFLLPPRVNIPDLVLCETAAAVAILSLTGTVREELLLAHTKGPAGPSAGLETSTLFLLTEMLSSGKPDLVANCAAAIGNLAPSPTCQRQLRVLWPQVSTYFLNLLLSEKSSSLHIAIWTLSEFSSKSDIKDLITSDQRIYNKIVELSKIQPPPLASEGDDAYYEQYLLNEVYRFTTTIMENLATP